MSIEQQPEALKVTFVNSQGDRTTLDFRRYHFSWSEAYYDDLFTCYLTADEPRLMFFSKPEYQASADSIAMGGKETSVMLLKAIDESLIVQWRSDSIRLWIGVVGSDIKVDSVWFRFPPLARPGRDLRQVGHLRRQPGASTEAADAERPAAQAATEADAKGKVTNPESRIERTLGRGASFA